LSRLQTDQGCFSAAPVSAQQQPQSHAARLPVSFNGR